MSKLANNEHRTKTLAYLIDEVIKSGRQTLVLSERIVQLKEILSILVSDYEYDKKDIGLYLGSTSKKERERVANQCRCILASTSMLNLGTDIDTLRALIFATPLSGVKQPIGRIRRIKEGMKKPFVLDFMDATYSEARTWFINRRKFYNAIGCKIHYL